MHTQSAVESNEKSPPKSGFASVARRWLRVLVVPFAFGVLASNFGTLDRRFDLLSNLPVQFMWGALGLTIGLLWVRSWRFAAVGAVCLIVSAAHVLPWYWPVRVSPTAHAAGVGETPIAIRLMLHNVWQPNTKYGEMIDHVREVSPDLVVFQEVDERWFDRLSPLLTDYPHVFHSPGGRWRGMAIFSRLPLKNVHEIVFNNPLSPSIVCEVEAGSQTISLVCTHPWPPIGEEMTSSRDEQLRLTGDFAGGLPRPAMIIGDLNTGMWSPHYKEFERRSGMRNARQGFGIIATHPMNEPFYPRVPIDHVLVSDDFMVRDVRRGAACGSDHAALIVDVEITVSD